MTEKKLSATYRFVNVDDLIIDMERQQPLAPVKVAAITRNFNNIAFGVIIVSARADGVMAVMDGQSRLAAAKKLGHKTVPALVWEGLSLNQEAQAFVLCNTARRNPRYLDMFRVKMQYDEHARALHDFVLAAGFVIGGAGENGIAAVQSLEFVQRHYGQDVLGRVLGIVRKTDAPRQFAIAAVIKGLAAICKRAPWFDDARMAEQMSETGLTAMRRQAASLREVFVDNMPRCWQTVLVRAYNQRLTTAKRIPE